MRTELQAMPTDVQLPALVGLGMACTGRNAEAIQWGEMGPAVARAGDMKPVVSCAEYTPARVYLVAGQPGRAMELLERADPKEAICFKPGRLRIDPISTPPLGNPQFEKPIAKAPT